MRHGTAKQREEMWRSAKDSMLADDKLLYTRKPGHLDS